jgi:multiple sugar transport system substrate-binding protein
MSYDFSRRDVFKIGAAGMVAGAAGGVLGRRAQAADMPFAPEKGAQLKVLRWTKFVPGDQTGFEENTKKFTEATGIKVDIEYQSWEDIRPKAAVAANVGSGPDIIFGWYDDAHQYPDKLIDVTDVADYLGKKYGGWAPVAKDYGTREGRWICLPFGASGQCLAYRKSYLEQAGFKEFPKNFDDYLKLAAALKKINHPLGFALGHAVGDGAGWTHQLIWAFGGKMVDEKNKVAINSPETIRALEWVKEFGSHFVPGTASWLDPHNNKAFLSDLVSVTNNGISIWVAAKNDKNPMADDIDHAPYPIGPVGKPTELHLLTSGMIFKYSKNPNAAKAYMTFLFEDPQYTHWQAASIGYFTHTLNHYDKNPIWTSDPKITPYRDTVKRMLPNGFAGTMGYASAAVMADYILLDMVAEAASGTTSPKDAAARAEKKARRYYG